MSLGAYFTPHTGRALGGVQKLWSDCPGARAGPGHPVPTFPRSLVASLSRLDLKLLTDTFIFLCFLSFLAFVRFFS